MTSDATTTEPGSRGAVITASRSDRSIANGGKKRQKCLLPQFRRNQDIAQLIFKGTVSQIASADLHSVI
jgi:hypothetical protein